MQAREEAHVTEPAACQQTSVNVERTQEGLKQICPVFYFKFDVCLGVVSVFSHVEVITHDSLGAVVN